MTKRPSLRFGAFASVAALVLGGLGACGSGEEPAGSAVSDDPLSSAARVNVTATATPSSVQAGGEVDVSATITTRKSVTADVHVTVYAPSGASAYNADWLAQQLTPGTPLVLTKAVTLATTDAAGTYTVGATVSRTGGGTLFSNASLTTFTVTSGTSVDGGAPPPPPSDGGGGSTGSAPSSPPVTWCETGLPASPYASAPAGAVVVPAGDNSGSIALNWNIAANTTYWFAPGTHTLGTGAFDQIQPKDGDTFIGAPGAILDGGGANQYAFTGNASGVTIEYLTVQNFVAPTDEIVVNHDGAPNWTISYDTFQNNRGGAVATGDNGVLTKNCLRNNNQYGFQGWGKNITIADNDIAANNPSGYYDLPGSTESCGCAGGGKFWGAFNANVTGNYVHDNKGVGLWADTNNAGFLVSGNYVSNNWSPGIMYEISYNAQITNNTLIKNAIGMGSNQTTPGFPDGAIYISESGGDSRVASNYAGQLLISGNVLTDNWGGVVLWENANRFCGSGIDNECTLVDPAVYTMTSCSANLAEKSPTDYYDNCRWKTQNALVENNTFSFDPANIGASCTQANLCGFQALFSEYGNAPYDADVTVAITFKQNNVFENNTYRGPWSFFVWSQGNLDNPITWAQWQAAVTDQCSTSSELQSGTCSSGFGQDQGSTLGP